MEINCINGFIRFTVEELDSEIEYLQQEIVEKSNEVRSLTCYLNLLKIEKENRQDE